MSKSKPYQGHKNWNHWNVSLWINNDEGLYRIALDCVRQSLNRAEAAERFLSELVRIHGPAAHDAHMTPDGAPYSASSIRAAMRGMWP